MTKQKNGTWKINEDEMRDIMICVFEGITRLEDLGCNSLAKSYRELYLEYATKDENAKEVLK